MSADDAAPGVQPKAGSRPLGAEPQRSDPWHGRDAPAADRRGHHARVQAGPGTRLRDRRPGTARAGRRQPRRERPRCDAERRPDYHRDRARRAERGLVPPARRCQSRLVRDALGRGHRHRHGREDLCPHLRALLHHEGAGQGDGTRPGDGLRHRQSKRRKYPGRERAGSGQHLHDLPASRRGCPGADRESEHRVAGARQRDRSGRRG